MKGLEAVLKKLIALMIAAILCFGLISCTSDGKKDDGEKTDETEVETQESDDVDDTTVEIVTDDEETEAPEETKRPEETEAPEKTDEPKKPRKPWENDEKETEAPEEETKKPKKPWENDEDEPEESGSTPLLYKVTDEDGDVVWLFGSIHVGRESFYPLPDYVMDAYESSEALAVEFDINAAAEDTLAMTRFLYSQIYYDGTTIEDHIPEELYERCVEILDENGYYFPGIERYNIGIWDMFISQCVNDNIDINVDLGIDMHFLSLAAEEGKDILDIESLELQMNILPSISEEAQVFVLRSNVESYDYLEEMEDGIEELMDVWESGDEERFEEALYEEPLEDETERALYKEYNDAMLTDRNVGMAEFAMEALEDGEEVFICVGAAHVVGEGAMADLLEEAGYTVELVR